MRKAFFLLLLTTLSTASLTSRAEAASSHNFSCDKLVCSNEPQLNPDRVITYWDEERMKEAWEVPAGVVSSPIAKPSKRADVYGYTLVTEPYGDHLPSRLTGILFFHEVENGKDKFRHCSGLVIKSVSQNVILTAAHCIISDNGSRDMLMFVPSYGESSNGSLEIPLQKWPVYQAFFPASFLLDGDDPSNDLAVARVYSESAPIGRQMTLEQRVGGGLKPLLTSADETFPTLELIGYPGLNSFEQVQYRIAKQRQCISTTTPNKINPAAITLLNCALLQGNSGGPIVMLRDRVDYVVGVGTKTIPRNGQTRLMVENFDPLFNRADEPQYVSAGDSYVSGTGLDPQKDRSGCGRFVSNPSTVLSKAMAWLDHDVSCGGATLLAGFLGPQPGDDFSEHPPQVDALDSNTKYLSVLFGGNDTGYATSLYLCIRNHQIGQPCKDRYGETIEAGIAELGGDLSRALSVARTRAPNAKIVVAGYPLVFPENSRTCLPPNVGPLTPDDISYFRDTMKRINTVISTTAQAHGVVYADMEQHFLGHDACQSPENRWIAMNNVEPGNGWNSALHPNPLGYSEMAKVLAAAFERQ